ncbi:MAG: UTP--glucose-1-phosphate uridylyltransferase GalU [Pseudomonadota bacterium]
MKNNSPVRVAVFPVAGLGTRFLPATKAVPKEMLTILDRPVIQYAVDEAKAAGIEQFVFVTGRNKAVIEDHFDLAYELQDTLEKRNKADALETLEKYQPRAGEASFTRQQAPLGLGHAVWCARNIVGDQPFALLLPDMVMKHDPGCLTGMVELYNQTGGNVVATEEVVWEETHKYGVVEKQDYDGPGFKITGMVEKPAPGTAPSNLFINGRYILQPDIFDLLEDQKPGAGNEIQLTDAMLKLSTNQDFYGYVYEGETYDCGSKEGFISANIAFALDDPEISDTVRQNITKLLK